MRAMRLRRCKYKQNKVWTILVNQAYSKFNETLINSQDTNSQIKNDETPRAEEYPDVKWFRRQKQT